MTAGNPPFMSGIPEFVLLRLLDRREMYGYELARSLKLVTGDALQLKEGVLYPALHALESRRLVRSRPATVNGRVRVYYTLTARGRNRLVRLTGDWRSISHAVESVLRSASHD